MFLWESVMQFLLFRLRLIVNFFHLLLHFVNAFDMLDVTIEVVGDFLLHVLVLLTSNEVDRQPVSLEPPRPADPMQVGLGVHHFFVVFSNHYRQVVVYHQRNGQDVDSSGQQIGANQHSGL